MLCYDILIFTRNFGEPDNITEYIFSYYKSLINLQDKKCLIEAAKYFYQFYSMSNFNKTLCINLREDDRFCLFFYKSIFNQINVKNFKFEFFILEKDSNGENQFSEKGQI